MTALPEHKEITDYFRSNIYEALSAYSAWKMLSHSRSNQVVSDELSKRYVEIQKYHASFFSSAERAFLVHFVIMILHPFDNRDDSHSLYKVDKKETEDFVQRNESVIDALRALRNKLFAHRDSKITHETKFIIPSVVNMDAFFEELIKLYNNLTKNVDRSFTDFRFAKEIKQDIERLFMNLFRGEADRLKEIDIEWSWEKDSKKASDVL